MQTMKQSAAIPKKVIKRPLSARIPRKRIMAAYHSHVNRLHAKQAPVLINRRNVVIGTDNSWFNAQVIDRDPAWVPVDNASYVWSARDLGSQYAIISRTFQLSTRRAIRAANLFLSVDNYAAVLINGVFVVYDAPQNTPAFFNPGRSFDVRRFLRRGVNDIVIIAFNFNSPRNPANPAGVAARLNIRLSGLL